MPSENNCKMSVFNKMIERTLMTKERKMELIIYKKLELIANLH